MAILTLLLFLFVIKTGTCINSHLFHFSGGNIAYGKIPRQVGIVGYWYIHKNDSSFAELKKKGYTEAALRGVLYVCKRNIEQKLIEASSTAAKRKKSELIKTMLGSSGSILHSTLPPYVDVSGCDVLQIKSENICCLPIFEFHLFLDEVVSTLKNILFDLFYFIFEKR